LAKIEAIYSREHRNTMSRAVAAHHLGYGGLHGASASLISALLKYGLLEGRGDQLRVSQDAVDAVTNPGDLSGREALRRAAFRPEVFSQLASHFSGPPPSEENVRVHLERKGFTAEAAGRAARTYLDTVQALTAHEPAPTSRNGDRPQVGDGAEEAPLAPPSPASGSPEKPDATEALTLTLPLPGDNWMTVRVGRKLSSQELEQLQPLFLDLFEQCLTEGASPSTGR
jgi:hypothetical protein